MLPEIIPFIAPLIEIYGEKKFNVIGNSKKNIKVIVVLIFCVLLIFLILFCFVNIKLIIFIDLEKVIF
jgi:hypothetical protein